MDIETNGYKKIKHSRDEIHETHSRILDHRRINEILEELKVDAF
jgi:hypothetical protein